MRRCSCRFLMFCALITSVALFAALPSHSPSPIVNEKGVILKVAGCGACYNDRYSDPICQSNFDLDNKKIQDGIINICAPYYRTDDDTFLPTVANSSAPVNSSCSNDLNWDFLDDCSPRDYTMDTTRLCFAFGVRCNNSTKGLGAGWIRPINNRTIAQIKQTIYEQVPNTRQIDVVKSICRTKKRDSRPLEVALKNFENHCVSPSPKKTIKPAQQLRTKFMKRSNNRTRGNKGR